MTIPMEKSYTTCEIFILIVKLFRGNVVTPKFLHKMIQDNSSHPDKLPGLRNSLFLCDFIDNFYKEKEGKIIYTDH